MSSSTTVANDRGDRARTLFLAGFNCAQSVLATCGPPRGLDRQDCLRYASILGGGIAHRGQMCGAMVGAGLLLGYLLPKTDTQDQRPRAERLFLELLKDFAAAQGGTQCRELLGVDIGTAAGRQQFVDKGLKQKVCAPAVRLGAELLEKLLAREGLVQASPA